MMTFRQPAGPAAQRSGTPVLPMWIVSRRDVVRVRELAEGDRAAVLALHGRSSAETLRRRYLHPSANLDALVDRILAAAGRTLVAETTIEGERRIVALAHLVHAPIVAEPDSVGAEPAGPREAELAFLVEDDWQGAGLGSRLLDLVTELARQDGWERLRAEVALDNDRMTRLLRARGWSIAVNDGVHVLGLALRSTDLD